MKIKLVGEKPTQAMVDAGCPTLVPELLAATGARYSRTDDGLDRILAEASDENQEAAADRIFRFALDYGHQSVLDMADVKLFMDGLSLSLIYWIWSQCPTGAGQETSTRYVKFSRDGLRSPYELGVSEPARWWELMDRCFAAYNRAYEIWTEVAEREPSVLRLPPSLVDQANAGDEKAKKTVDRLKRNYAFDRARYWIPVACANNMMLRMPARGWVELTQKLLSSPWPEANELGRGIVPQLELIVPRLTRHAVEKEYWRYGLREELRRFAVTASRIGLVGALSPDAENVTANCWAELNVMEGGRGSVAFARDLAYHPNRYAHIGPSLRQTAVRMDWGAIAMAELRDLNRQRPGDKFWDMMPVGFYYAMDQFPYYSSRIDPGRIAELDQLGKVGQEACQQASRLLSENDPSFIHWTLLGTQYAYSHLTTAAHFVYIAELRTGVGSHFRYAEHLRKMLALWYDRYPDTRGLILEGSAEPE